MTVDTEMEAADHGDVAVREAPTIRVMTDRTLDEAERIASLGDREGVAIDFEPDEVIFDLESLSCFYGSFRAVRDISLKIPRNQITAIIVLLVALLTVNAAAIYLRNRFERRW